MAKKEKNDIDINDFTKEEKSEISRILERCKGSTRTTILKSAANLSASERMKLVSYFQIEPKDLASSIVLFCLSPKKGVSEMTIGDSPNLFGNI